MKHVVTVGNTDFIIETGDQIIQNEKGDIAYTNEEKTRAKFNRTVGQITGTYIDRWNDDLVKPSQTVTLSPKSILQLANAINKLRKQVFVRDVKQADTGDDLPF